MVNGAARSGRGNISRGMAEPVKIQIRGGVAIVTLDRRRGDHMTMAVRDALSAAVSEAIEGGQARAIVLTARGRNFGTSLDPAERFAAGAKVGMGALCEMIEDSPIPVYVALQGVVSGAALELAMAAHYRIAHAGAILSMPDVRLGLCPSSGGTQRLARLIGPVAAGRMLMRAGRMRAPEAKEAGLVDLVVPEKLPEHTLRMVSEHHAGGQGPRPTRALRDKLTPPDRLLEELTALRERVASGPGHQGEAATRCLDCVESALLLPFAAALILEESAFEDLLSTPEAVALCHMQLAELRTGEPPLESAGEEAQFRQIGVIGGGAQGVGIAMAFLDAGLRVVLLEEGPREVEAAAETVLDAYTGREMQGEISRKAVDHAVAGLGVTADPADLAECDYVVDAGEQPGSERLARLEKVIAYLEPGVALAIAAPGRDLDAVAAKCGRVADVLGLKFLPPAHANRIVEVVVGARTGDPALARSVALLRRMGRFPILAGHAPGHVVLRVFAAGLAAAEWMLISGTPPEDIDSAMQDYGFRVGLLSAADALGLDRLAGLDRLPVARALVKAGRTGRRAGAGYFRYAKDGAEVFNPEVRNLLKKLAAERPGGRPSRDASEIQRRIVGAMTNCGARLYEAELAQWPSDIDLAMVVGFGFPPWKGGPMMAADQTGILRTRRDLEVYARDVPEIWQPAKLIDEMVKAGTSFGDMNTG